MFYYLSEKNSYPVNLASDRNTDNMMQLPQITQEKKKSIKYEWDEVILDPPNWEQSKIILDYLIHHHNLELHNKELKNWQTDIQSKNLLTVLEDQPIIFPSKMRSLKQIDKDINLLYGEGEKRRLRPGEESAIIQEIENMIEEFKTYPETIKLTLTKAIEKVLFMSKLTHLGSFFYCRKQVELHYRIMMTKFRCSDYYMDNLKIFKRHIMAIEDKILIDLNSDSILSEYLTKRMIKRDQISQSNTNNNFNTKAKSFTKK